MTSPRQYRLSPLDSTGWLFGLSGEQCFVLTASIALSGVFLNAHFNSVVVASPIVTGIVVAFIRMQSLTLPQLLVISFRRVALRLNDSHGWSGVTSPIDLPFLRHVEVVGVDGVGIVHDRRSHTVSASITASTTSFLLLDSDLQDASLLAWGDALAPFVESHAVASFSWHETAGSQLDNDDASAHTIVICVSVDLRRERNTNKRSMFQAGTETAIRETRLVADRLTNIGLIVEGPHSPGFTKELIDNRLAAKSSAHRLTLGHAVSATQAQDFSGCVAKTHVGVGNTLHRTYWIEQWPRTAMHASWLEPLLFLEDCQRTISLHMNPVSVNDSRRRIDRSATKLETDARQRERAGFRIGDSHRRNAQAVTDREFEIGEGFAEFTYSGLITISSSRIESLRAHCSSWEQRAASIGLRLVPLDGRHDIGLASSLPLGQAPLARRL